MELILLDPNDYQNIKYRGIHTKQTIDDANEKILEKVNKFNEMCRNEHNYLHEQINETLSKEIQKLGRNTQSIVSQKVDDKLNFWFVKINTQLNLICRNLANKLSNIMTNKKLQYFPGKLAEAFAETVDETSKQNTSSHTDKRFSTVTNNMLAKCKASVQSSIRECLECIALEYREQMKNLFKAFITERTKDCSEKISSLAADKAPKLEDIDIFIDEANNLCSSEIKKSEDEFNNNLSQYVADILNDKKSLDKLVSDEKDKIKTKIDEIIKNYEKELVKAVLGNINKNIGNKKGL